MLFAFNFYFHNFLGKFEMGKNAV